MGAANTKRVRKPRKGARDGDGEAAGEVRRSSGGGAAPNIGEIRNTIERQNREINGLTSDINRANEKLRTSTAKFRRAQDTLNNNLSSIAARRLARQERREAVDESRALNKIVRDSRRAQSKLIRERDKNQNTLRSSTQ